MTLDNRAAVILNVNAMRVTDHVIHSFKKYHCERLYVYESSTLNELDDIVNDIKKQKFCSVITAGGDGNIFSTLNSFQDSSLIPTMNIIALGTGNGLANLVGATKNYQQEIYDVMRIKDFRKQKVREFPLIEVTSRSSDEEWSEPSYYTFAGSGLDATVLNDYHELKLKHNKEWQKNYSHGLPGYMVASLFKTLPKIRKNKFSGVSIYLNEGSMYRIGKKNRNEVDKLKIKPGEDLSMVGNVQGISVGTTPEYGYGLKAHPYAFFGHNFANGMFQIRVIQGNPLKIAGNIFTHLPSVWNGTIRNKYLKDYFARDITIKYWVEDTPSHVAGEIMGSKKEIRYKFSDKKIKLVDKRR
jgi:diacylglycerol kinase family enzyme